MSSARPATAARRVDGILVHSLAAAAQQLAIDYAPIDVASPVYKVQVTRAIDRPTALQQFNQLITSTRP